MIKTVGVIGLGAMGRPMGRLLVEAGFTVVGYDPDRAACQAAREIGVSILDSPRAVAEQSHLVIILVGLQEQVETVVFGRDGLLAGVAPGFILGIASTISPTYARDLEVRLSDREVRLLDMPLSGGVRAAEAGHLLLLGGGDEALLDECRPVLGRFASEIHYLGPVGCGQVAKMVNNTILWACVAANDEGLRLGERLGVDPERLREALSRGSASNFALNQRSDDRPAPWAEKDLAIAQHEADRLRFSLPLAGLVKELIKAFKVRRGYPTPGTSTS